MQGWFDELGMLEEVDKREPRGFFNRLNDLSPVKYKFSFTSIYPRLEVVEVFKRWDPLFKFELALSKIKKKKMGLIDMDDIYELSLLKNMRFSLTCEKNLEGLFTLIDDTKLMFEERKYSLPLEKVNPPFNLNWYPLFKTSLQLELLDQIEKIMIPKWRFLKIEIYEDFSLTLI